MDDLQFVEISVPHCNIHSKLVTLPFKHLLSIANTAPTLSAVSGLLEKDGEFLLYIEKNTETSFTVRGSDNGDVTFQVNSTLPGINMAVTNKDVVISFKLDETETPQTLRYELRSWLPLILYYYRFTTNLST